MRRIPRDPPFVGMTGGDIAGKNIINASVGAGDVNIEFLK